MGEEGERKSLTRWKNVKLEEEATTKVKMKEKGKMFEGIIRRWQSHETKARKEKKEGKNLNNLKSRLTALHGVGRIAVKFTIKKRIIDPIRGSSTSLSSRRVNVYETRSDENLETGK